MELARHRNESPARHSNCRCAGIAGARLESRSALAWHGGVPSRASRDAGFFERTRNHYARIADAARCFVVQQARASRIGWRLVPHDVLKVGRVMQLARRGECAPFPDTACTGVRALPKTARTGVTRHNCRVLQRPLADLTMFQPTSFENFVISAPTRASETPPY